MNSQTWDYNSKLLLRAEWFDAVAQKKKTFRMSFFPGDGTVELYDLGVGKVFLRRAYCEGLRLKDLFVGNTVTVYGRPMKITEYADDTTRHFIGRWKQHTFAIIKPSGMPHVAEILSEIHAADFTIERLRMCAPSRAELIDICARPKDAPRPPVAVDKMTPGPIVAMELVGEDAVKRWREMVGPADPQEAAKVAPASLRARFGRDLADNAVHGAESREQAALCASYFFAQEVDRKPPANTAQLRGGTCCVVKPHALDEGKLGRIVGAILKHFDITAMQMFHLTPSSIEEFLEVYKGVVANYHAFLHSFTNGSCVAMEVSRKPGDPESRDVHGEFRKLCGPVDCDVAKTVRPNTLRAMFGKEKYLNAVHCTDLPEDCDQELEYFFRILDE